MKEAGGQNKEVWAKLTKLHLILHENNNNLMASRDYESALLINILGRNYVRRARSRDLKYK